MIYHAFRPEQIRRAFPSPIVTLGVFDGMHLGHQALFRRLLTVARQAQKDAVVITFSNHPREVLGDKAPSYLTGIDHRLRLLRAFGLDAALVLPFTRELMEMTPERFVEEILIDGLNIQGILLGYDGRFGKGGKGDLDTVRRVCKQRGHPLSIIEEVPPLMLDGRPVKSTRLREAIKKGNLVEAEQLLLRRVSCLGTVVPGDGRGRQIGFPTANLNLHHEVCPPPGVYKCIAQLGPRDFPRPAVVCIGYRPTFYTETPPATVEVHLLDFSGDLYGQEMELQFIRKIRDEQKFPSKEALIERIRQDIQESFPENS